MKSLTLSMCVASAFLTGCGGSSPSLPASPAPGIPAGYMRVTFKVAGALDFARYQYELILNTSGNGLTPEFGPRKTQWEAYSAAIRALSGGGHTYAEVIQYIPNKNPHQPPAQLRLRVTPEQFQFKANSNGGATAFSINFDRSILTAHSMKVSNDWKFNAATVNPKTLVDSMGRCDWCFRSPALNVNEIFDQTIDAAPRKAPQSARIVSVEVLNQP